MNQPKFSVGEEIILVSKNWGQFNGEYTILKIIPPKTSYIGHNGALCRNGSSNIAYLINHVFTNEGGREICWNESSLRKKHKSSEFKDFTSLMNNLKLPQKSVA